MSVAKVTSENDAKLTADIQNLTTQIQQLNSRNQELETQKNDLTELIRDMETDVNVSRAQWSIDAYCPKKHNGMFKNKQLDSRQCQRCQHDWQYSNSNCYVMNYPAAPGWKTWEEAQENCRGRNSDLVVIDNAAEKVREKNAFF